MFQKLVMDVVTSNSRVMTLFQCLPKFEEEDFSAKVSARTSAISALEVTISSPAFKCPTFNEVLQLIFRIMSIVFLTDDLEFNLDTYCLQDASLLCFIVRRALARAILNFERFS